ncbi:Ig-like domain-containing protein, partial [Pseudomonas sp. XK-1]|uniref:Ig-like domain-containing protein n=1 Tax=Pseudomonas sp. XK-1 TaxID=3136019 RepID=UPI003119555D
MTAALNQQGDGIDEELIEYQLLTDDGSDAIAVLLGLLAGGWLLSQDSGGHSSNGEEKDLTAPAQPGMVLEDDRGSVTVPIVEGAVTGDSTPAISGSNAEPNAQIALLIDGTMAAVITPDADGNWKYILPQLADGEHLLSVTQVDSAGNQSPATAYSFTVDTVAPAAPIIYLPDITKDNTPTLTGVGEPASTIKIFDNGNLIATVQSSETGHWIFTPAEALDDGTHVFTAQAIDAAGNESTLSAPSPLIIDTLAPSNPPTISGIYDNVPFIVGQISSGSSTNDTRPTLSGAGAEANSTVNIYDNGVLLDSVTADASGNWSYTPVTALTDSSHALSVSNVDAAGNEGPQSTPISFTVDTQAPSQSVSITAVTDDVAPVTGTVAHNGTTNDATPQLSGTLSASLVAGESVVILRDGTVIGTATVSGSTWTYQDSGLVDGQSYSYTARVEDAAGNRGTESNTYAITLDTTAPTQTVTLTQVLDNVDPISGAIAAGGTTNDDTPTLQGTLSAPLGSTEQLHVLRNGSDIGVATVSGTDWSYQDAGLASGSTYTYTAQVVDAAGNSSAASNSLSFTVNTSSVSQTVAILQLLDNVDPLQGNVANGGTSNDTTPTLSGSISTALSAGDVVEVLRDGSVIGTASVSATTWTYQDSGLLDGSTYSYTARVVIAGGNQGAQSAAYSLSIDTSAPTQTVAITSYTDDQAAQTGSFASGSSTNDTTPRLNGTLDAGLNSGETVAVYRDGALLGSATVSGSTWSFQDSGLVDGQSYSYTARVVDAAGNLGSPSAAFSLSIDTQAPASAPTIGSVLDDVPFIVGQISSGSSTNDTRPTLSGAGAEANSTVNIYDNGVLLDSVTADASGNWSYTPVTALTDSSHALSISNVDAAGNEGPQSTPISFTVDTQAPSQSVSITALTDDVAPVTGAVAHNGTTNDAAPQLSGSLSAALAAGETLVILRNGAVIGTATVSGSTWTYQDSGLVDGQSYSYTARVEDAAGNRGAISTSYTITLDTSAPTQTVAITTLLDNVDPVSGAVANGGTTNDSQPELQGTLSGALAGNEVVAVYRDGAKIGTASVNGTGWTFTDTTGLVNNASYSYTARVEDAAGNTGTPSSAYSITLQTNGPATTTAITAVTDDVAPVTGAVAHNGTTNDATPQLSGTLSASLAAGESVVILRDGTVIGTATVSGSTWTYQDSGLLDGQSYSYTARVEDAAGNRGTESNTYAITLDTTAPTQTVTLTQVLDNVDPISGAIAAGGTTNDDTPTLQGTLSAPLGSTEQLHVLRNGSDIGVATVSGTDWSYQDAGLASGSTYTYTAQVVDAAGNSSAASNSLSFTVNTSSVSQTVAILQLLDNVDPLQGNVANGGTSNDTTPTLSGSISTALSAGDVVEVLRDGSVIGTASVSATTWTYQDSGLLDGSTYSYTARVVIAGGNQGAQSAAYSLSIDTSAPTQTVAITSYTDDQAAQTGSFASGSSTNDTTPRLNGTLDAGLNSGETVAVYRDGALLGSATVSGSTWSFQDSGLVDGQSYSYTARVVDAAGNLGSPSAAFSLSIDTQAPA